MSNETTILADSIAHLPHLAAFDLMVKKRMSELELDALLVYLIDTVDASAIPYLAAQFDVLGYKGLRLATSELEQRAIIKRAIELHRYKGTLWAVREALTSIGYGAAIIEEHVEGHWAKFRVTIDLGDRQLNVLEITQLVNMIDEYKNVRSHLADLSYTVSLNDSVTALDISDEGPSDDTIDGITVGGDKRHNGRFLRNGTQNYSRDSDVLTIQIIPA